jgi:wobble nucleotide-excising tRNase
MIETIRLSTCATFTGAPAQLDGLRPVNYFFGHNGTGKTTIGRVIRQPSAYPSCEITWRDGTPVTAIVYNKDFVEANFRDSPVIKGVFTLGEEHVEARERLADARKRADAARAKGRGLRTQLQEKQRLASEAADRLHDACWAVKAGYAEEFKEAMRGVLDSRKSFAEKVLRESRDAGSTFSERAELRRKYSSAYDEAAEPVLEIAAVDAGGLANVEGNPIMGRPIIGSVDVPLAALISRLGNSDWVQQGQTFLSNAEGLCPFCQQPEPEHLREHLRAYFDESFEQDMDAVKADKARYESRAVSIRAAAEELSKVPERFVHGAKVEAVRQRLLRKLAANLQLIQAKVTEPSRKIELEPTIEEIEALNALVSIANEAIGEHNRMVRNQKAEREVVARQVWGLIAHELRRDLEAYTQDTKRLSDEAARIQAAISAADTEEETASRESRECEKSMAGVVATVEAINGMLHSLGFTSFSLALGPDPNTYKLIRADGTDAKDTLSEGERSFITFLYFYYLVEGGQEVNAVSGERIVVIDDPVSSLDGDVLFIVSTLVRSLAEKVQDPSSRLRQLFLLTHNVYFHREVAFSPRRQRGRPHTYETFWTVRKRGGVSIVERCETNPVTTSYDLLWGPVRTPDGNTGGVQNAMRRILENYFGMVGGLDVNKIESLFEGRDRIVCRSLLSWLHAGSHHSMDDLWVAPTDGVDVHLRVFSEIFEKSGHGSHYKMMMAGC